MLGFVEEVIKTILNKCQNKTFHYRYQDKDTPMDIRLGALRLYRKHLLEQYADRCGFWSLKDISGEGFSRVVVCMTDGADQAKYCLPRDPGLRSCYRSSKLRRPRLKVHGCWAFNYCLRIAILEETTQHGSSMVTEIIGHTLEDVARISRERGEAAPTTLVIVGDNTVKECKNQWLMSYLSALVSHGKFKRPGFN